MPEINTPFHQNLGTQCVVVIHSGQQDISVELTTSNVRAHFARHYKTGWSGVDYYTILESRLLQLSNWVIRSHTGQVLTCQC
jgi:hypothetical protein